jgi:phosphotransferase system HPr (HPr) family protein
MAMELRHTVRIVNDQGLHARPCHALAKTALGFACDVEVRVRGRRANAKSILELMTLGASAEDELELYASGPDAHAAIDALAALVGRGFGEL